MSNVVFEPFTINRLRLRNRIFMPAHTTNFGANHLPTERHVEYHRARARGGAALCIFEAIRVMENTLGRPQGVLGYKPECVPAYAKVADAVHGEGALFFAQICHMGRQIEGEYERTSSFGASPLRWSAGAYPPREMNRADMIAVRDAHLVTIENMRAAGVDGIELHWGHGHLLQQFLSPLSNQRTDEYGGSIENRMRFPLEVLRAARDLVGPDYCLGIRFSAEEFVPDGLVLAEAVEIIRRAVQAVQIDFIHVSHSAYHMSRSLGTQMADMGVDQSMFRHLPGAIRHAAAAAPNKVAIFTVCKYRDLDDVQSIVASGDADMVGLARAHIAEPAIVNKWRAGRFDEVRPCIGCNQGCAMNLEKNIGLTCFVNPMAGREGQWPEPDAARTAQPRRVLVIGGGPAGLEAAGVAASRGHRVTLWERSHRLGGRLSLAAGLRLREDFERFLRFARSRLDREKVAIVLGKQATSRDVIEFSADQVLLATGAEPNVITLGDGTRALTLDDAATIDPRGKHVAVFDETGDWGPLGLIEHLAESGARVTVLSPGAGVVWRTTIYSNTATLARWREKKIKIMTLRRPLALEDKVLVLEDWSTGEHETLADVDVLVGCSTSRAVHALEAPLRDHGLSPVLIGDCLAPRNALEAVFDGHRAARAL